MPHIDVSLYPGRGMEIKEPLAKKIEQLWAATATTYQ